MKQDYIEIPACGGKAVELRSGNAIEIVNSHGHQVVDFWALHAEQGAVYLSMEHTRAVLSKLAPTRGDVLFDNRRQPILTMEEDTFEGLHDTIIPPCDKARYELLGCRNYHANCVDNFFHAVTEIGYQFERCPASLNLWMNIPVDARGHLEWLPPVSKPQDYVRFRAHSDIVIVMSACPQDIIPINRNSPASVHFRIVSS